MTAIVFAPALYTQWFAVPETTVYAVLDGAAIPALPQTLARLGAESECLFRGELEPEMVQVAPYLAVVPLDHPFTDWLLEEVWGQSRGIFIISKANLRTLRMHLRTFLKVYDPDLKPLYFRYYDPRVLRVYLPTCNEQEVHTLFGPVLRFIIEGEKPDNLLRFWVEENGLKSEQLQLT